MCSFRGKEELLMEDDECIDAENDNKESGIATSGSTIYCKESDTIRRILSKNPMQIERGQSDDDCDTENDSLEGGLKKYSEMKKVMSRVFSTNSMNDIVQCGTTSKTCKELSKRSLISSSHGTNNGRLDVGESAWDIYDKQFQNAMRDREISLIARARALRQSCIITLIIFLGHVSVSCFFFCVWVEKWSLRDGLYFTLQTMTTVGYGTPAVPNTTPARIFMTMQMLVGIAILSVAISEVFQWVQFETSRIQFARDNTEIARRGLKLLSNQHGVTTLTEKLEILALEGSICDEISYCCVRCFRKQWQFFTATDRGRNLSLCLPLVLLVLLLAAVVGPLEGWDFVDSIYFSVVTLTTVGYGELVPTHPISIWFSTFFMIFAAIWLSLFYVAAATYYLKLHHWNINRIKKKLSQQPNNLDNIDNTTSQDPVVAEIMVDNAHCKKSPIPRSSYVHHQRQRSSREVFSNIEKQFRRSSTDIESTIEETFDGSNSQNLSQNSLNPPPIIMRAQIMKRVAIIISHEIAGQAIHLESRQNHLIVTYPSLTEVMEKWMIPVRARQAFQETVFKIICHVGINNLTSNKVDSLFDVPFLQVQEMVNPFVLALKNATTMDTWIACTNILAQELEPNESFLFPNI